MLYRVPVLLLSLMTHELAHAFVALRCGDNTAKQMGRISFNPLKHIDPLGAILLIAVGFGWAKPVPINPGNFKNKKAGVILTSLAGPLSNILLAIVFSAAYVIVKARAQPAPFMPISESDTLILNFLTQFYSVNIMLAAFNLIPIPPLDGSKVLFVFLPDRIYFNYVLKYERFGMLILLALSFSGFIMVILRPIVGFFYSFINAVVSPLSNIIL